MKSYCSQNRGDCASCSLVNYNRDCRNHPIEETEDHPESSNSIVHEKGSLSRKPKCNLIGADGNIFNLVGLASRALKKAGKPAAAKEMANRCFEAESYGVSLSIISEYVEVL